MRNLAGAVGVNESLLDSSSVGIGRVGNTPVLTLWGDAQMVCTDDACTFPL